MGYDLSWLLRPFQREPLVEHGCGNCRASFGSRAAFEEHLDSVLGVCPMLVVEREIADWNRIAIAELRRRGHEVPDSVVRRILPPVQDVE